MAAPGGRDGESLPLSPSPNLPPYLHADDLVDVGDSLLRVRDYIVSYPRVVEDPDPDIRRFCFRGRERDVPSDGECCSDDKRVAFHGAPRRVAGGCVSRTTPVTTAARAMTICGLLRVIAIVQREGEWIAVDAIDSDVGHSTPDHITVGVAVLLFFLRLDSRGGHVV